MRLTPEQKAEVQEAAKLWRSYLGSLQANVILSADRKEKLMTLVVLAYEVLKEQEDPQASQEQNPQASREQDPQASP
jgi:hypothetical protein